MRINKVIVTISMVFSLCTVCFSEVTSAAPEFNCKTMKNENYVLKDQIGKGPIVINFWATWCGPCLLEMKSMKPVYEKYASKGLQMLSVTIDDNKTQAQVPGVVRSYKFPYTILLDASKELYNKFHVANVPEMFIIDKKGNVVYHHQGFQKGDETEVEKKLTEIIAQE